MEKTLKDLESKLKALQEKTGDSAKQNIRDLQQKVLQLTKEVRERVKIVSFMCFFVVTNADDLPTFSNSLIIIRIHIFAD